MSMKTQYLSKESETCEGTLQKVKSLQIGKLL